MGEIYTLSHANQQFVPHKVIGSVPRVNDRITWGQSEFEVSEVKHTVELVCGTLTSSVTVVVTG